EGQREVEKQRRLQRFRKDIAPVNNLVKGVQLPRVLERVQHERNQTEDEKVGRVRSRPASEQHIKSNAEIHQRNQPEALVKAAIGRVQNHRHFQPHTI